MKIIGSDIARPARITFGFTFLRDGRPEVHEFAAFASMDAGTLARTMGGEDKEAISGMLEMLVRMLDNTDGTPVDWVAKPVTERPVTDSAQEAATAYSNPFADEQADEQTDDVIRFEAPDGQLLPLGQAAEWLEFDKGSSRRRWKQLLASETISLTADSLRELFEYLVSQVAKRPTRR